MSNEPYKAQEIEQKWRRRWEERGMHTVSDTDPRPKYYCLDMFPYPSGSGLHVGHWRGYVLSDVWSRYKTLQGYKVLHPMGWDAFGLPAENDAIKKGMHPRLGTDENIRTFRRQLDEGLWAAVPFTGPNGRRESIMVRSFEDVPRDADRVIFFPRAAGGR